jgi:D-3-phosphoglycerate dehydrogenase
VAEAIAPESLDILRQEAEVDLAQGVDAAELARRLADCQALVVRSQTRVTRQLIEAAPHLKVIARAGVGVDNVDVAAATHHGIVVVNSPEGNTISAAEHTMALLLGAARHLPQAHASVVEGRWERGRFTGQELYNKTLGVVGLGRIGREVAARAASFKMKVLACDPFVSVEYARERGIELVELDEMLAQSDFVTLHVPLTPETEGLIDARRLALMKPEAVLVNCARGGIVDEEALYEALSRGRLAGAALDVYRQEPPVGSPLLSLPNVVLTPHLAASTREAQVRVAVDVAEQVVAVLRGEPPRSAVNIPYLPPGAMAFLRPYLVLAERLGRFLRALAQGPPRRVRVTGRGELADADLSFLTKAVLKGLLEHELAETVNFVNAILVAEDRGIAITESKSHHCPTYSSLLEVEVETPRGRTRCAGVLFADELPRVVELDGYRISMVLEGVKLLTWQNDQPGVVGRVGTVLGQHDVNIAEMQVGRQEPRTRAVMVMSLDERPAPGVLEEIRKLPGIEDARLVVL